MDQRDTQRELCPGLHRFTYLSLKNKTSCCSSVTASKDKYGSRLVGVFGGGLFEVSEVKLGLTPVHSREE